MQSCTYVSLLAICLWFFPGKCIIAGHSCASGCILNICRHTCTFPRASCVHMGLRVIPTWPDGLAVTTPTGETVVFSPRFFYFICSLSYFFKNFFFRCDLSISFSLTWIWCDFILKSNMGFVTCVLILFHCNIVHSLATLLVTSVQLVIAENI